MHARLRRLHLTADARVHVLIVYLQRSIIVPPELGYGKDGLQEIPPNGTFELEIELLSVG